MYIFQYAFHTLERYTGNLQFHMTISIRECKTNADTLQSVSPQVSKGEKL
jgi:hypothetical protein